MKFLTADPMREALEAIAQTRVSPACRRIAEAALSAAVSPTPANALHDDKPSPDHVGEVGSAEREVGRYVYMLIEARMNAAPGTPEGRELSYLADIVADVEEYGAHELMGVDDFTDPSPHFAEAPPSPDHAALVGEAEAWLATGPNIGVNGEQFIRRLAAALHPSAEGGEYSSCNATRAAAEESCPASVEPSAVWRPMSEAPRDRQNVWLRPINPDEWGGDQFVGHYDPDEIGDVGAHWWVDLDGSRRGFDGSWPDADFSGWRALSSEELSSGDGLGPRSETLPDDKASLPQPSAEGE